MKRLEVLVKFSKGDMTYITMQTKLEKNCFICEGTGRIKYNDKDMRCPECMGEGKFKTDKKIHVVCQEPFIIHITKITLYDDNTATVKYKGHCGYNTYSRAEENIFSTKEEAQSRCDELNKEKIYLKVDQIVIQDIFKQTKPSIDKIQNKLEYYKREGKFDKNIVVDKNNKLRDGYINYLISKMLNINTVEVVVENLKLIKE